MQNRGRWPQHRAIAICSKPLCSSPPHRPWRYTLHWLQPQPHTEPTARLLALASATACRKALPVALVLASAFWEVLAMTFASRLQNSNRTPASSVALILASRSLGLESCSVSAGTVTFTVAHILGSCRPKASKSWPRMLLKWLKRLGP